MRRRDYPTVVIDGVEVEPLVVTTDGPLPHGHRGSIHVEKAAARLTDSHQGSVSLHDGASLSLSGVHQGSLHIDTGCRVVVTGMQQGSVHVDPGGEIVVDARGTHQGSIHNLGRYELRGTRGGSLHGNGEYVEFAGCRVVEPKLRSGVSYYEW